jgi:hypothetical protein
MNCVEIISAEGVGGLYFLAQLRALAFSLGPQSPARGVERGPLLLA